MGAELEWLAGAIRFGKDFKTAETRDPYTGACSVVNLGGGVCLIAPMAGREMDRVLHDEIVQECADVIYRRHANFKTLRVEREGRWWEYDLTSRPFKRKRM